MNAADPVDALRPLLPAWIGLAQPFVLLASGFVTGAIAARVGARVALLRRRRLGDLHWTERARRVWPAAMAMGPVPWAAAATYYGVASIGAGPLVALPAPLVGFAAALATFLGASLAIARTLSQLTGRPHRWLEQAATSLLAATVLAPHVLVVLLMAIYIGPEAGAANLGRIALGLAAFVVLFREGGFPLARLFGVARPPSPKVARAVQRAAERCGIRPRSVSEIETGTANAFAFPRSGRIVFTRRAVEVLDDDELVGVACHELAHLAEPARVAWARSVHTLALFPLGLYRLAQESFGGGGIALVLVPLLLVSLFAGRLRRQMESRADDMAHDHASDGRVYAGAIEKLYRANLVPAVLGTRARSHPDLYDRLLAAGRTPDYPRPLPPSRMRALAGCVAGCATISALVFIACLLWRFVPIAIADREQRLIAELALTGGYPFTFFELADVHATDGRWRQARPFLDAALALDADAPDVLALDAWIRAMTADCDAARAHLTRAIEEEPESESIYESDWIEAARRTVDTRCSARAAR